MKNQLLILIIFFFNFCFPQKAEYKKITIYSQYEKYGNWIIDQNIFYSSEGKVEKHEYYGINGEKYSVYETIYSSGKEKIFKQFGVDGLEHTLEYIYNNNGDVQKTIKRDKLGNELEYTIYTYKKNKSKSTELRKDIYDANSILIDTDLIKYDYDQNGDLILQQETYKRGTVTYEYNNKKLISLKWTNPYSTNTDIYNSNGDLIKSISNGELKFSYKYDYDSRGSWIIKYIMLEDGSYVPSRKREIEYN